MPGMPTTFLTYKVSTIDGKSHSVQLYYDNTAEVSMREVCRVIGGRCAG